MVSKHQVGSTKHIDKAIRSNLLYERAAGSLVVKEYARNFSRNLVDLEKSRCYLKRVSWISLIPVSISLILLWL